MKYKIIVDYGKPFEIICNNKEILFNKLLKVENSYYNNEGETPYFDILILKGDLDITDKIMKEYNFKKEKVGFLK